MPLTFLLILFFRKRLPEPGFQLSYEGDLDFSLDYEGVAFLNLDFSLGYEGDAFLDLDFSLDYE
ncbi:537_t:CDS:2, partial [Funneliformis geosporum]